MCLINRRRIPTSFAIQRGKYKVEGVVTRVNMANFPTSSRSNVVRSRQGRMKHNAVMNLFMRGTTVFKESRVELHHSVKVVVQTLDMGLWIKTNRGIKN